MLQALKTSAVQPGTLVAIDVHGTAIAFANLGGGSPSQGLRHDVEALEDSVFLLTIALPGRVKQPAA